MHARRMPVKFVFFVLTCLNIKSYIPGWQERVTCLNNLAACHVKLGDFEKCVLDCTQALQIDPSNGTRFPPGALPSRHSCMHTQPKTVFVSQKKPGCVEE